MPQSTVFHAVRRIAFAGAVALLAVLASPAVEVSATNSRRLVFFGDSLSDSGNHFLTFRDISTRPFEIIPDAPYAIGGLHFTNGQTWALLWDGIHPTKAGHALVAAAAAEVLTAP